MENIINEYDEVSTKIKELKVRKEELRSEILIYLKERDLTKIETEEFQVEIKSQSRKSLDKEELSTFLLSKGFDIGEFETYTDSERLILRRIK